MNERPLTRCTACHHPARCLDDGRCWPCHEARFYPVKLQAPPPVPAPVAAKGNFDTLRKLRLERGEGRYMNADQHHSYFGVWPWDIATTDQRDRDV